MYLNFCFQQTCTYKNANIFFALGKVFCYGFILRLHKVKRSNYEVIRLLISLNPRKSKLNEAVFLSSFCFKLLVFCFFFYPNFFPIQNLFEKTLAAVAAVVATTSKQPFFFYRSTSLFAFV